jgi:hypothetical protein
MPPNQKNKQKTNRASKKARSTPLILPHNPREAKKLAEMNAIIEKMIFLPGDIEEPGPKRKR